MNEVRLIEGDCLVEMRKLADGSVDCIVTSPPYNQLGKRIPSKGSGLMSGNAWVAKVAVKGYADDMTEPNYRDWLKRVAEECARVTRPGGSMFFNHKIRYREGEMFHPIDYVRDWPGWNLRQEIIWDVAGAIAFNCGLFAPTEERIYWMVKPGEKNDWNPGSAGMLSVWRVDRNRHIKGTVKDHPCPFPVEIPIRCIKAVTQPGDLILDPFAGSASTLVACLKTGRRGIGYEIEPRYVEAGNRRLRDAATPLFNTLEHTPCDTSSPSPS